MKSYKAIILTLDGVLYQGDEVVLSQETEAALKALNNEYLMALATTDKESRSKLRRLGVSDFFDVVIDGGIMKSSDLESEVLRRAAKRLAVRPFEALVVTKGDAAVTTARKCGFDVAEVGEGASDERAIYHISSLADLLKL